MERFLTIDWKPAIEDVIDDVFINEDRLEKESVMHKIINGNFVDPFKDIEEDYKNINVDLFKTMEGEFDAENDSTEVEKEKKDIKRPIQREDVKKNKHYVPGIVKSAFKFPRKSNLNKEQQALCLRVMLRFSESSKPKLTQTEREEVQAYMDLKQIISQEQDEFLEFAKSKWTSRSFKLICQDYINIRWKSKLQYIKQLPRHYAEVTNVPFVADKPIGIRFLCTCLQMGQLPKIVLPNFTRPYILRANSQELEERFPPKGYIQGKIPPYKLPVSEDPNCHRLAEENNVDLVISSSGLNCLVNNIGSNYSNSWILPIVIKLQHGKHIAYIDKSAPPIANTIPEKNSWVYKYILRRFLIHSKHPFPRGTSKAGAELCNYDNVFGNVTSEELLKLEDKYENTLEDVNCKYYTTNYVENENTANVSNQDTSNSDINPHYTQTTVGQCEENTQNVYVLNNLAENKGETASSESQTDDVQTIYTENAERKNTLNIQPDKSKGKLKKSKFFNTDNVSYKLFTIGPQSLEQNELMKNSVVKEFKILVRTKTDGFEQLQDGTRRMLILAPKLEHQVDLGAEAVTLEESLRQWISLIFRPDAFLARARISAETSEILQIEHRTAMSINNEIKRLYDIKVEDSLAIFHNTIQSLTNLSPGRYIMRHTLRNGAFATVYKEASSPGKNVFDLHCVFTENFQTLPNTTWLPIDTIVTTPMHKCFERMPAMFYPSNVTVSSKKKNMKETKKSNTEVVRRSLRNKKKK